MIHSNTSLERAAHGHWPRVPLTNADRLRIFRQRLAQSATPEFNNFFPAGRLAGTQPKEQQR